MPSNIAKNWPNCNHHLTKRALALADRLWARFGNGPAAVYEEYPSMRAEIQELLDHGFLVYEKDNKYSRNLQPFGPGRG